MAKADDYYQVNGSVVPSYFLLPLSLCCKCVRVCACVCVYVRVCVCSCVCVSLSYKGAVYLLLFKLARL